MQRPSYGQPIPANSPPLHHPVPQHVSTVPQLRSPPPPVPPQSQNSYGSSPYQPQGSSSSAHAFGPYGGFMNDQTAQMGFQVGQTALKHGQEYVEQNVRFALKMIKTHQTDNSSSSTGISMFPLSSTTLMSQMHMLLISSFLYYSHGDIRHGPESSQ